ncbi:MAG TPA: glycine/sarcosine/betaine reductase selenoprotein B family protein [Acidobacteriota bacterium]|nr:glycine/sarcosine/betaine reductase selenoprotein B family protein [Acidobacteriota bacterium]
MRGEYEEKAPDSRRLLEEEEFLRDSSETRLLQQSMETLRQGFNWIAHFQRQHPGYEFLQFEDIPMAEAPELSEARVALVSTAGVYVEGQKPFSISPGEVGDEWLQYRFKESGDPTFRIIPSDVDPESLRLAHPYLDISGAEEDINIVFPLTRLRELEEENFIGGLAAFHISFMGYLPDPYEVEPEAEEAVQRLLDDGVDLVVMTPGEVLSHQTMGLVQRIIEDAGIATISITLCRDITERIGVPRAAHYRFPFGFTLGETNEEAVQLRILKDLLRSVREIEEPGVIVDLPYEWVD